MAVQLKHTVAKVKNKDGAWEGIPALKGESVYDIAVRNGYVGTEDELVEQMLSDGWVTSCIKLENEKANSTDVYTKSQILTDRTKDLYGMTSDALPDDILASLSKFDSHTWLKTSAKKQYDLKISNETSIVTIVNAVHDDTDQTEVYYGDSIAMDADGKISIPNPTTGYVCYIGYAYGNSNPVLNGQYFTLDNRVIYKAVTGLSKYRERDVSRDRYDYFVTIQAQVVYSEEIDDGSTEYVYSTVRNAYPDTGEVNGFKYSYLGTCLANAINGLHYKFDKYVGTGTVGKDHPNKWTLDFVPKMVMVARDNRGGPNAGAYGFIYIGQPGGYSAPVFSVKDKTFSWYYDGDDATYQCNLAGVTYYRFALG